MKETGSCKLECDICAKPVPENEGFFLEETMPFWDNEKYLQVVPAVVCQSCQDE